MPKILFINTHLGSNYQELIPILSSYPQVVCFCTETVYDSIDKLMALMSRSHLSAIFVDVLFFNHSIHRHLLKHCSFLHVISPFDHERIKYSPDAAARYYEGRVKGIREQHRLTPGSVLIEV